jgi:hypothetical protein
MPLYVILEQSSRLGTPVRSTPPAVAFISRRMRHMVFGKQVRRISEVGTCKMVAL